MKCPPGYKYDKKTKSCVPKKGVRVMRFRPYINLAIEKKPKKNGNGNGNKNGNGKGNGNGNGNGGNGNGGNGSSGGNGQ